MQSLAVAQALAQTEARTDDNRPHRFILQPHLTCIYPNIFVFYQ
jgi:hypothetical protein